MDPSRKRAIRLSVLLTLAVLLATALIYTSFSAGERDVTASELLKTAKPGHSYILAGTVLDGSVRHYGPVLDFRIRDPKARHLGARALHRRGAGSLPGGPRSAGNGDRGRLGVRWPAELADDEVSVEIRGRERRVQAASRAQLMEGGCDRRDLVMAELWPARGTYH